MITHADLKTHTKSELAKMAKRLGIAGCDRMLKDELATQVAKASRRKVNGSKSIAAKSYGSKSGSIESNRAKPRSAKSHDANSNGTKVSNPTSGGRGAASAKNNSGAKSSRVSQTQAITASGKAGKATPAKAKATIKSESTKKKTQPKTPANSKLQTQKPPLRKAAAAKTSGAKTPNVQATAGKSAPKRLVASKAKEATPPREPTNPKVLKQIRELQLQRDSHKDIAFRPMLVKPPGASEPIWEKEPQKDRVALFVRDAYWLHASWDITRQAIERAKAAMAEQWHSARPVLRLLRLDDTGTTSTSEMVQRDMEIHGGLRNWYIDWTGEPASFRVMIGYLTPTGRFHAVCESNTVRTPAAGHSDNIDQHWSDAASQSERIYALSGGYDSTTDTSELKEMLEDRLHRQLGAPALAQLGAGVESPFRRRGDFHFDMDIELVLYGSTVPDGYLTLNGEPVSLREDGTFVMRLPFPDRRQVLPAIACSRDGSQQRTIVVAVERNTKIMEPLEKEQDTGE